MPTMSEGPKAHQQLVGISLVPPCGSGTMDTSMGPSSCGYRRAG